VDHYAGIDVSLEASHLCVVDGEGRILKEAKVASDPDALSAWFADSGVPSDSSAAFKERSNPCCRTSSSR